MAKSTKPRSATSFKETAFGILPRSKIIKLEAKGIKKVQQYIIKLSNRKTKISPQVVLDIHKVGFGFIFPDWTGKFRTIDITVGNYEPPHYSKVPELVKNLCDDLAERLKHLSSPQNEEVFLSELISLLAWFQHRFVWIHPFRDYNGRVARLLTNLLLLNLGFPILSIKAETGIDRVNEILDVAEAKGLSISWGTKSFKISYQDKNNSLKKILEIYHYGTVYVIYTLKAERTEFEKKLYQQFDQALDLSKSYQTDKSQFKAGKRSLFSLNNDQYQVFLETLKLLGNHSAD